MCCYSTHATGSTRAPSSHCGVPVGFALHSKTHSGIAIELRVLSQSFHETDNPRRARKLRRLPDNESKFAEPPWLLAEPPGMQVAFKLTTCT